jgi:hypothetical protein
MADTPVVTVLRWPGDAALMEQFDHMGLLRLFLVEADADPPVLTDLLSDWVRLPAEERDVEARLCLLRHRAGQQVVVPALDGSCRLSFRGAWVALSPIEYCLATALVEQFGRLVSDRELARRAWGSKATTPNTLRVHLTRLRRRVRPVGLEVVAVRSQGHVMQEIRAVHPQPLPQAVVSLSDLGELVP